MEASALCLDVYPVIAKYLDWNTLVQMKFVSFDMMYIAETEIEKRLKSEDPLGCSDSVVRVTIDKDRIHNIGVKSLDQIITLPHPYYSLNWCQSLLLQWFSHPERNWLQKYSLLKQIIRFANRNNCGDRMESLTDKLVLTFDLNRIENQYMSKLVLVEPN